MGIRRRRRRSFTAKCLMEVIKAMICQQQQPSNLNPLYGESQVAAEKF